MNAFSTRSPFPRISVMAACCLLIAGTACWADAAEPEGAESTKSPSPVAAKNPPLSAMEIKLQQEAKTREKLKEPTSFEFKETPLHQAIEFLRKQHEIDLVLDEVGLKEAKVARNQPVSLELADVSLMAGLRNLLRPLDLFPVVDGDSVLITSFEYAERNLRIRVFPVRDLIQFKDADGNLRTDADFLLLLIDSMIQMPTWTSYRGLGSAKVENGLLTVRQTGEVLDEVELLLTALRKIPLVESPVENFSHEPFWLKPHDANWQKNQEALDKVVPLDFKQTPLTDVVAFLREATGVPILIDAQSLNDPFLTEEDREQTEQKASFDLQAPITIQSKALSVRAAMQIVLRDLHANLIVRDEVLTLTSEEEYDRAVLCKLYPVQDLLLLPKNPEPEDYSRELNKISLEIQTFVSTLAWGSGHFLPAIRMLPQQGTLVVSATLSDQEEITHLLAEMRARKSQQDPETEAAPLDLDQPETVVYTFSYARLLSDKEDQHIDTEKLVTLIPEILDPEIWTDQEQASIRALEDRLVVRHTIRVQRRVESLLKQLGAGVTAHRPETSPLYEDPLGMMRHHYGRGELSNRRGMSGGGGGGDGNFDLGDGGGGGGDPDASGEGGAGDEKKD